MTRYLAALMIVVTACAVPAQAPQLAPNEVAAIKADLERIKTDLEAVKIQLGEVLRLVSQRSVRALASSQLAEHAHAVGIEGTKFAKCLASGRYAVRVAQGVADGAAIGVQGTPTFVVGRTMAGNFVEGTAIRGAQPLEMSDGSSTRRP